MTSDRILSPFIYHSMDVHLSERIIYLESIELNFLLSQISGKTYVIDGQTRTETHCLRVERNFVSSLQKWVF